MHVLTCSISLAWSNLQWSQNGLVLPYMNISHANKTKLAAERAGRIQMLTGRSPMAPTTIDSKNCIRFGPSELIPRHLQIKTKFRDKPSRGFRLEPIRGKPDFLSRRRARLRTSAQFRDSSARREITSESRLRNVSTMLCSAGINPVLQTDHAETMTQAP